MLNGSSTLPPHLSDEFYWYAPDGLLLEVQVNGDGVWRPTSREADPNGVMGFRLDLVGPDAPAVPGGVELRYGYNRFTVRVDSGAVQDGGNVYVGAPGGWVDQYDPVVYSTIITGVANPAAVVPDPYPFAAQSALAVATGILATLTFGLIHPAGRAADEFRSSGPPRRLAVKHRPLLGVDRVGAVDAVGVVVTLEPGTWRVRGDGVDVAQQWTPGVDWRYPTARDLLGGGHMCMDGQPVVTRVDYRFGSTIDAAARGALLHLARQYWMRGQGQRCELPARASSVSREGVSIQIDTAQDYLEKGRTGVNVVDLWLMSVSPAGPRLGRSGVFAADSPPPFTVDYAVSL